MQSFKIPENLNENQQQEFLFKAFTKIVDACKTKKLKKFEVEVIYGEPLPNGMPCSIIWDLKKIKSWLKEDHSKWLNKDGSAKEISSDESELED